jgi:thiamine-phosphate pyrophosphorylase
MSAQRATIRPAPRLYVVTPPVGVSRLAVGSEGMRSPQSPAELARSLAQALAGIDAAAVLLRLPDGDERGLINAVKEFAPAVQATGAAVLIDGRPDIVARGGADGAHFAGPALLKEALPRLKPDRIAGAGGLRSRHDAMLAAEAGADYVMFGEPDVAGARPAFAAVIERVAWWAEVFEIPCVAYASGIDEVEAMAAAGADFVALGEALFDDPRGLKAALAQAAARLAVTEPAA